MADKEVIIERLWRNNWLNIRKATETAKTRNPYKMYVGIELARTVMDDTGNLHPYASATWNYIKTGNHFNIIVCSYYEDEYISKFLKVFNLKCDWININPDFQTSSKPFVDCYIDAAAGFNPPEWQYVLEMFKISERELNAQSRLFKKKL